MEDASGDQIPTLKHLLDELQDETGLNDSKLAIYLGVDRTTIAKFRADLEDLPSHAKIAIYDHLGYFRALSWFKRALPEKASEKLTAWSERHSAWLAKNPQRAKKEKQTVPVVAAISAERVVVQEEGTSTQGPDATSQALTDWLQLILELNSKGVTPSMVRAAFTDSQAALEAGDSQPLNVTTQTDLSPSSWRW